MSKGIVIFFAVASLILIAVVCSVIAALWLSLADVTLQTPTATFSQNYNGFFSVACAVDGVTNDNLGWAIYPQIGVQTAVFQTGRTAGFRGGSVLTVNLIQNYFANPGHTIGRFRLSVTTDEQSTFADGLISSGYVKANWTALKPDFAVSSAGATLTTLADNSILASGRSSGTDVYTVRALTSINGITGIRLEMLPDPSLPSGGPGRAQNGNFVLSEITLNVAPQPAAFVRLGVIGGALAMGVCLAAMVILINDRKIVAA